MTKRVADSQITRETFREEGSDSDNENNSSSTNRMAASASTMRKRKIAMPKRIGAGDFNFHAKASNGDGNHIENNNDSSKEPLGESQMSKTFSTFKQMQSNDGINNNDTNAKLKALNCQFKDKLIEILTEDSFADLRPVLEKYKQYIEPLKSKKSSVLSQSPTGGENVKFSEKESRMKGPKFTLRSKPTTLDSVFTFGIKNDNDSKSQGEGDDKNEVQIKGPQFTINGEVKSDIFKLDKPIEGVGKENTFQPDKSGSAFSNSVSKPPFSVGKEGSQVGRPVFDSVQTRTKNEPQKRPTFGFDFKSNGSESSPSEPDKNGGKPSFSFKFGEERTSEPQDAKVEKSKSVFAFGNQDASLNGKKDGNAKAALSFGSSNSSTAPSFSFSKPNSDNKDNNTETKAGRANNNTSNGGFKFSLPFTQNPATQSSPLPSLSAQTDQNRESKQGNDKEVSLKPVEIQNGEENENVLFSQRSKLMIFNSETKSYDSKGLGELKLLQNKQDKSKVRLLCRSDGMGNILLNTSLVKSFTYSPLTPESDNLIKLPVVEAQDKLVTFVVKFKQKSDGRSLIKSIEDVKKDM